MHQMLFVFFHRFYLILFNCSLLLCVKDTGSYAAYIRRVLLPAILQGQLVG